MGREELFARALFQVSRYSAAMNSSGDISAWRSAPDSVPTFNSECIGMTQPIRPAPNDHVAPALTHFLESEFLKRAECLDSGYTRELRHAPEE